MIGANVIFHVASAVAAMGLVWALLRLRTQRDTLRHLLAMAAHQGRSSIVMEPGRFLQKVSSACGLPFEVQGSVLQARKIALAPWRKLFSSQPVSLLRWNEQTSGQHAATLIIFVASDCPCDAESTERELAASLGEGIQIKIQQEIGR